MGRGSLGKFRYESGELRVDPKRVGRHAGKSETSRGTHEEVWDVSGDPRGF